MKLSTGKFSTFHRGCGKILRYEDTRYEIKYLVSSYLLYLVSNSKAGVDVGSNVPDIVLYVGIAVFQSDFDLADGVQYGGVVPAEFLADVRQA